MAAKRLYFIAVMPPDRIREEVTQLKLLFSKNYGASHALKSPPHLTLIPPFKWPEEREDELVQSLDTFSETIDPFKLELKDFGAFRPRVIYIEVIKNGHLDSLYWKIIDHIDPEIKNQIRNIKRFNPHMTLATRDLTTENFHKAWSKFRDETYAETFVIDRIIVLKHNGKYWDIVSESFLGNN